MFISCVYCERYVRVTGEEDQTGYKTPRPGAPSPACRGRPRSVIATQPPPGHTPPTDMGTENTPAYSDNTHTQHYRLWSGAFLQYLAIYHLMPKTRQSDKINLSCAVREEERLSGPDCLSLSLSSAIDSD